MTFWRIKFLTLQSLVFGSKEIQLAGLWESCYLRLLVLFCIVSFYTMLPALFLHHGILKKAVEQSDKIHKRTHCENVSVVQERLGQRKGENRWHSSFPSVFIKFLFFLFPRNFYFPVPGHFLSFPLPLGGVVRTFLHLRVEDRRDLDNHPKGERSWSDERPPNDYRRRAKRSLTSRSFRRTRSKAPGPSSVLFCSLSHLLRRQNTG